MEKKVMDLEDRLAQKDEEKYAFEARMQWAEETVAAQQKGSIDGEVSKWMRRSRNAEEAKAKLEEEKLVLEAALAAEKEARVKGATDFPGENGNGTARKKDNNKKAGGGGLENNLRRDLEIKGVGNGLRIGPNPNSNPNPKWMGN